MDDERQPIQLTTEEGEAVLWGIDFLLEMRSRFGGGMVLDGTRWPSQLRAAKARLEAAGHANPYPGPPDMPAARGIDE